MVKKWKLQYMTFVFQQIYFEEVNFSRTPLCPLQDVNFSIACLCACSKYLHALQDVNFSITHLHALQDSTSWKHFCMHAPWCQPLKSQCACALQDVNFWRAHSHAFQDVNFWRAWFVCAGHVKHTRCTCSLTYTPPRPYVCWYSYLNCAFI